VVATFVLVLVGWTALSCSAGVLYVAWRRKQRERDELLAQLYREMRAQRNGHGVGTRDPRRRSPRP
jgi:hypothetical protein